VALVLTVAAVGGAGTMVVELAAVRLLAPWFGTSQAVWTNVIGVVLLALAIGYLAGARRSRRGRALADLGTALVVAGGLCGVLPAFAAPLARSFLPAGVTLQEAAELVTWGSLATALVLFLPPALLLGAVSPLAVEAVATREPGRAGRAGRAGGEVLCASTLGSLAGVFGTSHALLPGLGLRGSFLLAGALLGAAGLGALALARVGRRGRAAALAWLALGVASGAVAGRPRPALAPGVRLLDATESRYQSVRVVEDASREPVMRFLQVNEGFDSFQSAWLPRPGLFPEGFYYNDFALPLGWSPEAARWRVLVLGLGGGSAFRLLEGTAPDGVELVLEGVELDAAVVRLARRHLDLGADPRERIVAGVDARVALAAEAGRYEQIVLDCYANQVEIPPHLCTREFFAEVRERLEPGGWLTANVGGFGFDDPVVAAVGRSMAVGTGAPVLVLRVPGSRNHTLVARRDAALPLSEGPEGPRLCELADAALSRALIAPRALPGSFRVIPPDGAAGELLTDERNPIELLQARSIALARQRRDGREGS